VERGKRLSLGGGEHRRGGRCQRNGGGRSGDEARETRISDPLAVGHQNVDELRDSCVGTDAGFGQRPGERSDPLVRTSHWVRLVVALERIERFPDSIEELRERTGLRHVSDHRRMVTANVPAPPQLLGARGRSSDRGVPSLLEAVVVGQVSQHVGLRSSSDPAYNA